MNTDQHTSGNVESDSRRSYSRQLETSTITRKPVRYGHN